MSTTGIFHPVRPIQKRFWECRLSPSAGRFCRCPSAVVCSSLCMCQYPWFKRKPPAPTREARGIGRMKKQRPSVAQPNTKGILNFIIQIASIFLLYGCYSPGIRSDPTEGSNYLALDTQRVSWAYSASRPRFLPAYFDGQIPNP